MSVSYIIFYIVCPNFRFDVGTSFLGAGNVGRRGSGDDLPSMFGASNGGTGVPTLPNIVALCEECEARMKALDHSELLPFFTVNADEQPASVLRQVIKPMPLIHCQIFRAITICCARKVSLTSINYMNYMDCNGGNLCIGLYVA